MSTTEKRHAQMQPGPLCTRASLAGDLRPLLSPGDTILLHTSLRSIGYVVGGAPTLVQAILDVLTPSGTVVVPTHTSDNSDPQQWENPPVPEQWWTTIRTETPAFDTQTTRTRGMGVVAETVRTWPGSKRSAHPQTSFAAVGANAAYIVEDHALDSMLGEQSPLAKLESPNVRGKVVLLGVGFDVCTALHLAEYRLISDKLNMGPNSFAAMVDGQRQWMTVNDVVVNSDDFVQLGRDFEQRGGVTRGRVGGAEAMVFDVDDVVAFAKEWLEENRPYIQNRY